MSGSRVPASSQSALQPRRRGVATLTTGFVLVGLSAFVLLAATPRLVGADDYSVVAFIWTAVTVAGLGLALPAEQAVTRAIAAGRGFGALSATAVRLLVMTIMASAALVAAAALGAVEVLADRPALAWWGVVGFLGWAGLGLARGLAAGQMQLRPYAASQLVEAGTRVLLVALAWVVPGSLRLSVLVAATAAPLVLALPALVGVVRRAAATRPDPGLSPSPRGQVRATGELLGFTAVSLSQQVVLNSAPLWVGATGAFGAAAAGVLVSATTYLRAPTLALGGLITVSLSRQSTLWSQTRWGELRSAAYRYWALSTAFAVVACGTLLALSGWMLPLFYGGPADIPGSWLVALTLGTVVSVLAWSVTLSLLGAHRLRCAVVAWCAAAAVSTVAFAAAGSGSSPALVAGLVAGPTVALVGGLLAWRLVLRQWGTDPR